MPIEWVMLCTQLIFCFPLHLCFQLSRIRIFSNESVLHPRWPKNCSLYFSISPSNEYSRFISFQCSSVQFSLSVVSYFLRPHESLHARPPCPSPSPGVYSNSRPSSQWCHPAISSCYPLFLLPPIPPNIRVFANESTLCMRWPKYWSFSFSIIPSKEYPGLISFRMDWLDLLAVQGTLKSLLQHHSSKVSILTSNIIARAAKASQRNSVQHGVRIGFLPATIPHCQSLFHNLVEKGSEDHSAQSDVSFWECPISFQCFKCWYLSSFFFCLGKCVFYTW